MTTDQVNRTLDNLRVIVLVHAKNNLSTARQNMRYAKESYADHATITATSTRFQDAVREIKALRGE